MFGTSVVTNSTVSENSATSDPGSIAWGGGIKASDIAIRNSTVSGNSAKIGGGIRTYRGTVEHCHGDVVDLGGGNLADDATCIPALGVLTALDSTLADNGGPTATHKLDAGSTAIDPLPGSCGFGTDQRGAGRMGRCDSGAYEYLGPGCGLTELASATLSSFQEVDACHTALVGPDYRIDGPGGELDLEAGFLVNIGNGFEIGLDGQASFDINPALLP